tara:strand:- start:591 stop:821 length:231 start_codon:yes stop_codon:yes gene_type:complete
MEISDRDRVEELSSFYSDDGSREAYVLLNHENKEYEVMMVTCEGKNFSVKEVRSMENHNERYAEDCAENWVLGVIE